jgi:hypothetical protein
VALKRSGSVIGIVTGYGMDVWGVTVRVPVRSRTFHIIQIGSGVHPTSYPMGTEDPFPGGKAAWAWSWPLISTSCRGQETVDLYIHSLIRLNGTVLNSLSIGTTLPLYGLKPATKQDKGKIVRQICPCAYFSTTPRRHMAEWRYSYPVRQLVLHGGKLPSERSNVGILK